MDDVLQQIGELKIRHGQMMKLYKQYDIMSYSLKHPKIIDVCIDITFKHQQKLMAAKLKVTDHFTYICKKYLPFKVGTPNDYHTAHAILRHMKDIAEDTRKVADLFTIFSNDEQKDYFFDKKYSQADIWNIPINESFVHAFFSDWIYTEKLQLRK